LVEPPKTDLPPGLDPANLPELERAAAHLAQRGGERIAAALGRDLSVQFKGAFLGGAVNSNPVSEVDHEVEHFLRAQLAERFPGHTVIGEELGAVHPDDVPFTWVIDPIDGTTNFINGLPLFACSVGLLYEGWPIAGAIWCASTHALRPGVYHARHRGPLCFDGAPLKRRPGASWRGLATEPGRAPLFGAHWDTRVMGSSTIEFAFVAAGLLRFAYIPRPRIWDVAAGLALVHASGCAAMARDDSHWQPLVRFSAVHGPAGESKHLCHWRESTIVGDADAIALALASVPHLQ
jgi:myo-inositol-1(or 4)-monophosphatase